MKAKLLKIYFVEILVLPLLAVKVFHNSEGNLSPVNLIIFGLRLTSKSLIVLLELICEIIF